MKIVNVTLITLLLTACAATTENAEPANANELADQKGYVLGDEVQSIHNYRIDGWQYLSNRSLILPAGPSVYFLVMLDRNCSELRSAEAIALSTTMGNLRSGFDAVIVRDSASGMTRSCFIDQMYQLSKKTAAE